MQFRNYPSGALACGLALSLALAGCGGGGSSGPRVTATATAAPPSIPAPPSTPSAPSAADFDGTYAGFFAGIDQQGNVITLTANSSAFSGAFGTEIAPSSANNASPNSLSASGTVTTDGTVTETAQGGTLLPGSVTINGTVQPLGSGLFFSAQAQGQNAQNSQGVATITFRGRVLGLQDSTNSPYAGSYTGTLAGSGGSGTFNFDVLTGGNARGDITSLSTLDTVLIGFSQPKVIGIVTRDGVARFYGVSGMAGASGSAASMLNIDFQGQGTITAGVPTITGFYAIGDPSDGLTGTFTATRNG